MFNHRFAHFYFIDMFVGYHWWTESIKRYLIGFVPSRIQRDFLSRGREEHRDKKNKRRKREDAEDESRCWRFFSFRCRPKYIATTMKSAPLVSFSLAKGSVGLRYRHFSFSPLCLLQNKKREDILKKFLCLTSARQKKRKEMRRNRIG